MKTAPQVWVAMPKLRTEEPIARIIFQIGQLSTNRHLRLTWHAVIFAGHTRAWLHLKVSVYLTYNLMNLVIHQTSLLSATSQHAHPTIRLGCTILISNSQYIHYCIWAPFILSFRLWSLYGLRIWSILFRLMPHQATDFYRDYSIPCWGAVFRLARDVRN